MSSTHPSCFLTVAYASLSSTDSQSSADFNALREFCLQIPGRVEVLAEEEQPNEMPRPFWNEVLNLIEHGNVATLIVPGLFHIAGDDISRLSHLLALLRIHGVRLLSLGEGIDSLRDSCKEILSYAIRAKSESKMTEAPAFSRGVV